MSRPGFVLAPWVEMSDFDLHRLHLQVLGRDAGHFVRDLIALDGDVLAVHVGDVNEDVLSAVRRPDEAMTLRSGEVFAHSFEHRP